MILKGTNKYLGKVAEATIDRELVYMIKHNTMEEWMQESAASQI